MSARDLLTRLRAIGAQVWTTGPDSIHYKCPKEVLTADLLADLKAAKSELIALCTIGRGDPDACPVCGYVHGALTDRAPCSVCGSEDWRLSLVDARGCGRICLGCIRAQAGKTPRSAQLDRSGAAENGSSGGVR